VPEATIDATTDGASVEPGVDVATAVVRLGPVRSDVHRARGAGPLRLLCPRAGGNAAWIVTSSLGGGLVDGDAVALEVDVDAGATCVVTTQASSKVYKGTTSQRTRVRVAGDGAALVVPDAVVPYRDATYTQVTAIELGAESTLVLCDVLTAGRIAYGERWSATRLDTLLSITRGGVLQLHDRVVLAGEVAQRMRRFEALGTAVLLGPRVREHAAARIAELGPVERGAPVIVAGSPLADGALFRIAGESIEQVVHATRALVREACAALGEDPWSRKW
jgi:urease accessory protein